MDPKNMNPVNTETNDEPSCPSDKPTLSRSANIFLWIAFAGTLAAAGLITVFRAHGALTPDACFGGVMHLVRTAFWVSVGLTLESFLLRSGDVYLTASRQRRVVLHMFQILVMFVGILIIVDALFFPFTGYHVTTGVAVIFADGVRGVFTVIDAAGLSFRMFVLSLALVLLSVGGAVFLSKKTRALSLQRGIRVRRRDAIKGTFILLGIMACLDMIGYHLRNPYLWEREIRSTPMAFALIRPDASLSSFKVRLKDPVPGTIEDRAVSSPAAALPDIYLVVIESLRRDMMTPEVMPRLSAFAAQNWTMDHAVTTGNVTHYSWYGLLCAEYPVYFDAAKTDPQFQGSLPMEMLRLLGYRIHLLATPDTAYQNLESVIFKPGGALLYRKFHPADATAPERDRHVIGELVRMIRQTPPGGKFHLVALDSTHYEYLWEKTFAPRFQPFAAGASVTKNYRKDLAARELIKNRFRNSAAWVDSLLGDFFDALESSGRMGSSIVVITGDHGESFGEHGPSTHGTDLCREQLDVAFAMHVPHGTPHRFPTVFSLMDVMPTILDHAGCKPHDGWPFPGKPFHPVPGDTPSAAHTPERPAVTFQGWNENSFRFSLIQRNRCSLLELDTENPKDAKRLRIKDVSDLWPDDGSTDRNAYPEFLRELPDIMENLPFLDFNRKL
jgi:hypothetical protein